MYGPLAILTSPYPHLVDGKSGLLQPSKERGVGACRPDAEDAAGPESRSRSFEAARGIKAIIGLAGQAIGTVVYIE